MQIEPSYSVLVKAKFLLAEKLVPSKICNYSFDKFLKFIYNL